MDAKRIFRSRLLRSAGRRRALVLVVAAVCSAAVALLVSRSSDAPAGGALASAIGRCDKFGRRAGIIRCQADALHSTFARRGPSTGITVVKRLAGYPHLRLFTAHCHRTLHEVAMRYARERSLTMSRLRDVLAPTYGPGCASGFNHGLIIYAGGQLDPSELVASERSICGHLRLRFSRQACVHGIGHAFLVIWEGQLGRALAWCRRLGAVAAPDCADAAFHGTALSPPAGQPPPAPSRLCRGQRGSFAEVCWRRAWTSALEYEVGPRERWSPDRWMARCGRQPRPSRAGCVTSVSRHLPSPPSGDLAYCRALTRPDLLPCVKGILVSNLRPDDRAEQLDLIGGCAQLAGRQGETCSEVLGRNLNVLTDGVFGRSGCARLAPSRHRAACRRGARRFGQALVTYG